MTVPPTEDGSFKAAVTDFPSEMRFCGPLHCATLRGTGGRDDAIYDDDDEHSTYTIELFTPGNVRIRRVDEDGKKMVLTGRMSKDGNSIADGIIRSENGGNSPFKMAWGKGIESMPKHGLSQK